MVMGNIQVNTWDRFWTWYETHTTKSRLVMAIIIYIQIPHMVWAGDVFLQTGIISYHNVVLDFFLYGIDLIEVIPMITVAMLIYSKIKKRGD